MGEERVATSQRRLAIAGMAGNILEWYDFSIYGFFAYAIGQNFFPSHSKSTSLIDALSVPENANRRECVTRCNSWPITPACDTTTRYRPGAIPANR